jgi:CheY-like chemotaxis protein
MTDAAHSLLIVDDEFASLEVLALLLTGEGFHVLTASNGEEALRVLGESAVSLVITDYKMPKMDGSELCLRMLADPRLAAIPVIFTSATYRQDVPSPDNIAAFFGKPLLFAEVLRAVHEILAATVTPRRG